MGILLFIVFGFAIGLLARALIPGRQSMGVAMTAVVGMVGSFIGGLVANLVSGRNVYDLTPAGFIGSLLGALLLLAAIGPMLRRRAI